MTYAQEQEPNITSTQKRKTMRIKKGFILREVCGENVVTAEGIENINFNKLISLNQSAAFLFKKFAGKDFTEKDLAEALVSEYGIDMELALKDSARLCNRLTETGIAE